MNQSWYATLFIPKENLPLGWKENMVCTGFFMGSILISLLSSFNVYQGLHLIAWVEFSFALLLFSLALILVFWGKALRPLSLLGFMSLLIFPTWSTYLAGGFWESGGRGVWSFMAPLGSLIICPGWTTLLFLLGFILVLVFSLWCPTGVLLYSEEMLNGLLNFNLIGIFIFSFVVFFVFYQILERQRFQIEKQKIAEQAHLLKNEFLNVMSHEIRTPLNAITGLVDVLMLESPKIEQLEKLQTMRYASMNLLLLVNDILDFSKLQEGHIELEKRAFNLKELLEKNVEAFTETATENQVTLHFYWHSTGGTWVEGDEMRFQQVLFNLLSNAIKFSKGGEVWLEVTCDKKQLLLSCADNGIGISQGQQESVFNSFSKADMSSTRKGGGTGLGLAIVKRIVEIADGDLKLMSEKGKGSTFEITFPWPLVALPSFEKLNEKVLPNWDVLVVDDNDLNLKVAASLLQNLGVRPAMVKSGDEALVWLKKFTCDLVLMDLQMPEMDGFETTRLIRCELNLDIPIIPFTAEVLDNVKERTQEVGMQSFLAKPINRDRMWNCLIAFEKTIGKS